MDWENLLREIDNRFPFLVKVRASRNGLEPSTLHPMLRVSTGMVISAIFSEKLNRIVILFPNRFHLDKWITILSVLELLKRDYQTESTEFYDFQPGQKLLMNNKYIVEFEGIADGKIWILALNNKTHTKSRIVLKTDRIIQFQSVETKRRLSSDNKVWQEYKNAPESPIDSILNIYTAGNKSFFESNIIYVGRTGKTVEYINTTKLNKTKLVDLFLWGKHNTEGNVSIINSGGIQATPSCIIFPDLYSVVNYCNFDEERSRAIIISSTSFCKNDPQSFTTLLDSKIPIIIITDFNDSEDPEYLSEFNFKIWQWDERNLREITRQFRSQENSIFNSFHRTLINLYKQKINTVVCNYPELESIAHELTVFEKNIRQQNDQLQNLCSYLYQLYNEFSRLIRFPSQEWVRNYQERVNNLQARFKTYRLWIPTETMSQLNKIISALLKLCGNSFACENHKLDQLKKLLLENSTVGKTIVVVPRYKDVEETKGYWQKKFVDFPEKLNDVVFLAASDLLPDSISFIPDRVIVCGWLGQSLMYSLLHSYITDNITLLVYPNEAKWFKGATSRWRKNRRFRSDFREFSKLLNFPEDFFDSLADDVVEGPDLPEESPEENILELERRLKQYRYGGYKTIQSSEDVIEKAKLVIFNNEQFAFFTKSHKSLIVTDLIRESDSKIEIQKLTLSDIKVGDYILFFSSDKDLIHEIADKILNERGKADLRAKATFWRKVLCKKTGKLPIDAMVSILRQHGCKRHELTIKNWLHDDIIGPANPDDIKIILKAFAPSLCDNNFNELIAEIISAISEVRGAHLKASSLLAQQLIKKLPEIFSQEGEITRQLTIEIPEFGRVFVLKIEEIGNEWLDIEKRNTNRLLSEESF